MERKIIGITAGKIQMEMADMFSACYHKLLDNDSIFIDKKNILTYQGNYMIARISKFAEDEKNCFSLFIFDKTRNPKSLIYSHTDTNDLVAFERNARDAVKLFYSDYFNDVEIPIADIFDMHDIKYLLDNWSVSEKDKETVIEYIESPNLLTLNFDSTFYEVFANLLDELNIEYEDVY